MYNPAFMPKHQFVLGLPVLSSTQLSFDSDNLSFNEIFQKNEDGELIPFGDEEKFISNLKDKNDIDLDANVSILFMGYRIGPNYFTFSATERAEIAFDFPRELGTWGVKGPADPSVSQSSLTGENLSLNGVAFHEIALGYSRQINEQLSAGARFKYLKGVLSVSTEELQGEIFTSMDTTFINVDQLVLNTSGFDTDFNIEGDPPIWGDNNGFAIDLGAQYKLNDRWTFSFSVTDIGSIKWKETTVKHLLNDTSYSFNGFPILELIKEEVAGDEKDLIQTELDNIESIFNPDSVLGEAFTTKLKTKFYGGATFSITPKHKVGGLIYTSLFEGKFRPAFSINYNFQATKVFNGVINTSFVDGNFNNIGAGFSVTLGAFQLYATSNNLISVALPARANVFDVRLGINLLFGHPTKEKKGPRLEGDLDAPPSYGGVTGVTPTGTAGAPKHDPKKIKKDKEKRIKQSYKKKKRKRYN